MLIKYIRKSSIAAALLSSLLLSTGTLLASDQIPAPPQKQPIALVGGTIHTVSGATIANGTILFDKGKITAIGTSVTIPADALRINIPGKHVYPGLIEAASQIGLVEIAAESATRDMAELGTMNPNVRAEVAVNPDSELIPVARSNGLAIVATLPVGGMIAGKAAAIMLDGWTWEDVTLKAPVGMVVNWPNMRVNTSSNARPAAAKQRENIQKRLDALTEIIQEARAYKLAATTQGQKGAQFYKKDARLEALQPVINGELPLWIVANHVKQIQTAVDWTTREKLKMVLVGGADSWMVTDLLNSADIPVILTPVLRTPSRRHEGVNSPFKLPAILHDAGIKFCIGGGSTTFGNDRNLPYHAAKAASYGLDKKVALQSITLASAEILGIADRVGSLETGKDATLIVTNGDPLEIPTQVEKLYLQGRDVDLGDKQKSLYEKYKQKYAR